MRRNNFNTNNNNNNKNKVAIIKENEFHMKEHMNHKTICKLSFRELRFTEINQELIDIKTKFTSNSFFRVDSLQSSPLTIFQDHVKQTLAQIKSENPIINYQMLSPVDVKLNPLLFPFQLKTSDQTVVTNLKYCLDHQLTINYLKLSKSKITAKEYKSTFKTMATTYDKSHELKIHQVFINYDKTVIPFLNNESGHFRPHEIIQGIGVSQVLAKNNTNVYAKTEAGPGDFFISENGNYVLLDIKSCDLSEHQIKELLIKNINKYKKFDKSYLCLNGDEDQIKNIIQRENIEIPNNIVLLYQNTEENFKNKGFYDLDSLDKKKHFSNLHDQLSQPKFKQKVEKLLDKHSQSTDFDLAAFEKELNQLIDINSFIDSQNIGDNFFDPETISDFNDFNSNFNDNNDPSKSD